MVGSTAADVEPKWEVADHDYIKGYQAKESVNERLTPAEEDLITQLTSALDEVPSPDVTQVSSDGVTISIDDLAVQTEALGTPDILKDFLDFEMTANIPNDHDAQFMLDTQSLKEPRHLVTARAPSPISKEQILDFLQDKVTSASPESIVGSESGYESVLSPRSLGSPEELDHNIDIDMDSFTELFPSLL